MGKIALIAPKVTPVPAVGSEVGSKNDPTNGANVPVESWLYFPCSVGILLPVAGSLVGSRFPVIAVKGKATVHRMPYRTS